MAKTKLEMAKEIVDNPMWNGIHNPYRLADLYSKRELQDALEMAEMAYAEYCTEFDYE